MKFHTTYRLEDYILKTQWNDLPETVKKRAIDCGIELMIMLILGSKEESFQNSRYIASYMQDGKLEIPGSRDRFGFLGAAVAMGHASKPPEAASRHYIVKGHPAASVAAGILAAGLEKDITYREYLTTLVVACDTAVRMGSAMQDYYNFHQNTGTYGAAGTAAGIGRIFGLTREQMNTAISMAEYHAPMAPVRRSLSGEEEKKEGIWFGTAVGALAVLDTLAGETARTHLLESEKYMSLTESLGNIYEIMNVAFKPYSSCRWACQPIQAAVGLLGEYGIDVEEIERVVIHTFHAAAQLGRTVPRSEDEARYHIVYPIAAAIVDGDAGFRRMNSRILSDPYVADMAERICFEEDDELELYFPEKRMAWVEIVLEDGRVLRSKVYSSEKASAGRRSRTGVTEKFNRVMSPYLNRNGKAAVLSVLTQDSEQKLRDVVADINVALDVYGYKK